MNYAHYVNPMLPWEVSEEESSRFRKILIAILLFCLIFGIVIPLVDVPEDVRVVNKVPDRLVKLVIEQKKEVIPPPVVPKEEPKEETKPEEKEEPKPEEQKKEEPKPEPKKQSAKAVAEEKAAVFDVFADLRESTVLEDLTDTTELTLSGTEATETRREVLGNSALADSGGINVGVASSSKGSTTAIKGPATTAVQSKIKGFAQRQVANNEGGKAGVRTSENIQLVFGKNQDAIFRAYNRALRSNPSLRGEVVFRLVIQPSGKVSKVTIVSSELNDPKLERRLISSIKRLNFGKMNVEVWEDNYPIIFAPQ
ncbi:MAG: AgmX/PglI C-terminal domain-containing protein [Kangiellaceae bacterium]|jgi:hypothetical protein|nr:AgmX/PglI C-terminal domain-containing protein [Kangiellaceae bacterium]